MFFPNRIPFLIPLGTDLEDDDGDFVVNNNDDDHNDNNIGSNDEDVSYDYGEYSTSLEENLELNKTRSSLQKSNQGDLFSFRLLTEKHFLCLGLEPGIATKLVLLKRLL